MSELISRVLDTGALYHDLLFSYQRAQKLYHGQRGSNYVSQSTISYLLTIEKQGKLDFENSVSFEEALSKFTDFLKKGHVIKSIKLVELDSFKYSVRVEGCVFAGRVHKLVNTKGVICPYALIAIALYNKFKDKQANETESLYLEDGTETIIEPPPI